MNTTPLHSTLPTASSAELGARLDPWAPGFENVRFKSLAGPFMDEVWRADGLSGSQRLLCYFLCNVTLRQGLQRVFFNSLDAAGEFLKLPRSRVHPMLFGEWKENLPNGVWLPGLAQDYAPGNVGRVMGNFRLFSFEEMGGASERRWLLTVWPDSAGWNVAWRWPAGALRLAAGALLAERNQITPYARELAPAADLTDARAVVSAEAALERDALNAGAQCVGAKRADGFESSFFLSQNAGAQVVQCGERERAGNFCRSGKGNGDKGVFQGESRSVPEKGTGLRLKDLRKPKLKLRSVEEHKRALYELESTRDDDRVRELLCVILGEDAGQNDAGKWIVRRWRERARVQRVMAGLIERIHDAAQPAVAFPAAVAELYWKKSKESLKYT